MKFGEKRGEVIRMDTYNMIDFNEKKGFICDMDGVIYHGNRVLPGVAEFIQWLHALVAPIEMATGTQAYFCGKPNPLMMRTGLKMLHCHSAEAVMVGDRMDTDVISGMESGMSTVLVLSGVSTRETIKTYAYRPSMVLNGVGDIVGFARGEKTED